MNDTLDVILVNRCDQSDKFQTVLPAKMCVRVLLILMLAAAAVLAVGAGVGAAATTWYAEGGESVKMADETAMSSYGTIGWMHIGYDLNNTRYYPFPSTTSASGFSLSRTSPNKGMILTGDITGNGKLELVSAFEEKVCALDKDGNELWSNNVATDSGISGAKVNAVDLADMDGDGVAEIVVGVSPLTSHVKSQMRILIYGGNGNLLKAITTVESTQIAPVKCEDLNGDGKKEVVATVSAGYILKPRGVYVYDYTTGSELWHYDVGPVVYVDSITDINNDGNPEIILGSSSPHNGNSDHGTDDSHSYVFAFDKDGNNLWTKQIGWCGILSSVGDLNGDNVPEIISFRFQTSYSGPNDIYILDPANGDILDTYNGPTTKGWKGWAIADINGDGKREIVVGNEDNTLRVLDHDLNLIDSSTMSGTVQAINDINGDGNEEIIVCTDDSRVVILDNKLDELWSYELGGTGNAIVSDLIPGGANEIIASADKLYTLSGTGEGEEQDVKIKGKVINIGYPISFPPIYTIEIGEVIEDPLNKFHAEDEILVSYDWGTPAEIDSGIEIGDDVDVYGAYCEGGYDIILTESEHYLKRMEDTVHNIDTGESFTKIQDAIDDSGTDNGDMITVDPGTYTENVNVYKSLTIKSTSGNPEYTIVQAAVSDQNYQNVFTVTADNVEINGFTIKGASYYSCSGVYLDSHNCIISNNAFENNAVGIWVFGDGEDRGNIIRHNNFSSSSGYGPDSALYLEAITNIYLNNFMVGVGWNWPGSVWHSPEPITYEYEGNTFTNYLGNYWDGYSDVDDENDGIWDHSYSINDEERDYYPLVEPFGNYLTIGLSKVIYGFWPHWKDPQSYQPDWSGLTHISYFCMGANSNGTLNTSNIEADHDDDGITDYDSIRNTAHSHNVKVTLTVTCFDHNMQDDILAYHRNDLVNNISQKLQHYGADGVSIDFEGVNGTNSKTGESNIFLMKQFMQTLHDTLKNANHKYHISFCVQGWEDPVYYNNTTNLSQYTDAVFLMGYDYHLADYDSSKEWKNSTGAVSPYFGVIESVERLCEYYPKDKIILGVPFYGYDWACESKLPGAKRLNSTGTSVEMKDAITYAQKNESLWDSNSHTPWYRYNQSDTWHQCWYDNETSLGLKFDYVNSANLAGTGFWALGFEGNNADIWNVVKEKFSGHGLTIGELVEKLNDDPENVVNKKFAANGFVYASTHETWEGVEILNDLLVAIEKATIDPLPLPEPIKNLVKELLNYMSPAQVWNYCFGLHSMIIMSTSESDQTYGYLPCIQAYAEDDNLWPEQGSVVHIEGTWEKRSILWKNIGYIFKVDKVIVDKSYKNFEDIEDLGENAEVKMVVVIAKERIASDNTYHFLSGPTLEVYLKLPEGVQIPNLAITEIHGEITDKNYKGKKVEYTITVDNLILLLADHDAQLQSPDRSKESIIIDCPVNATITDQYGRIISDDGINEIPDADLIIINDTKIFHLLADLTYSTVIDAYDAGTFNFTRISPIGTDISITKFENIPITASTKAFVEIVPDEANYTMSIDYDGDGVYETNITPDVNETIVVTPTHEITKQITTSADDGYSSPSEHYDPTANLTMVGTFGEVDFNGWYRFQNVTIPEGANITRAFTTLTAYSDIYTEVPDDTLKTVIHAEYAANPLPPSSASDHAGRTRTPQSVEWDITGWEVGEIYSSPDISDIIQGLVNVHDYSSGAAIQIFHDATDDVHDVLYQPEAASGEGYITACTYDHSPLDAARLYIEYTVTSLRGDLNHDNRITPADAAIALRLAATGAHDPAADVSGDGCVTSLDALMILQAAAGVVDSL